MISSESTLEPLEQLILMIHRSGILRDSRIFGQRVNICVCVAGIVTLELLIKLLYNLRKHARLRETPKKMLCYKAGKEGGPSERGTISPRLLQSDDVCGD